MPVEHWLHLDMTLHQTCTRLASVCIENMKEESIPSDSAERQIFLDTEKMERGYLGLNRSYAAGCALFMLGLGLYMK